MLFGFRHAKIPLLRFLFTLALRCLASPVCIPDVSASLLSDGSVVQHPDVRRAFEEVEKTLAAYFKIGYTEGISLAMTHASTPHTIFSFNHGPQRLNESLGAEITANTSFRIISATKNIAATTALIAIKQSRSQTRIPRLTLDTRLVDVLPSFSLSEQDWENGGSEITLSMLGSASSGLPREGYQTQFDDFTGLARATVEVIGDFWAEATPESIIGNVSQQGLVFAPSQRASYSNAGFALLGHGIAEYHNRLWNSSLSWSDLAVKEILCPLDMSNSFFGPIPTVQKKNIAVPNTPNWADLKIGNGYGPTVGMWSSANDIVKYLHEIWLRSAPELITKTQRRVVLQPRVILPDGVQQVGFGWEISLVQPDGANETYSLYGKTGDGGGYHSYLSLVPDLGFGIVVLTAEGSPTSDSYVRLVPEIIATSAYDLLIPAFRTAYSSGIASRLAGNYSLPGSSPDESNHAIVEVEDNVLWLRSLVYGNDSALLRLDQLGWSGDAEPIYFASNNGSALAPSDVGEGMNFRIFAESTLCDYMDFDGYTDCNGWALDRVQFLEHGNGTVELRYPPLKASLFRA